MRKIPSKRKEKWKRKTFSLSLDAIDKLKEGCNFMGLKESQYIEFLIIQHAESLDPLEKLEESNKRIKQLRESLKKEEEVYMSCSKDLQQYQKWLKEKQDKKPQAINILKRKLLDRDILEVERKAKVWSKILGISPLNLIAEAQEELNVSGI